MAKQCLCYVIYNYNHLYFEIDANFYPNLWLVILAITFRGQNTTSFDFYIDWLNILLLRKIKILGLVLNFLQANVFGKGLSFYFLPE